jgi:hypothetical protein
MVRPLTTRAGAALASLLALLFIAPPLVASTPPVQQPAADTITGTLHTLDTSAGTLRVTTGVGMALRLVELRLTPETRVTEGGAPLAIAALRPGDVVRVTGGAREQALVAYTIERLRAGPGGAP